MAKALIGYLNSDLQTARLAADNRRLRERISDLEAIVLRLTEENDRLASAQADALLELDAGLDAEEIAQSLKEMQPV